MPSKLVAEITDAKISEALQQALGVAASRDATFLRRRDHAISMLTHYFP